jgi:signal transduction protein with GAF and PtsI domain
MARLTDQDLTGFRVGYLLSPKTRENMSNLEILEAKPAHLAPRYLRQLEVTRQISQLIGSDEKVEIILQTGLQFLLQTLKYRTAQIYRLSPSGKDLWLYLELGVGIKPVAQTINLFSIDEENIISEVVRTRKPVYLPDLDQVPYTYYLSEPHQTRSSIRSDLALPLNHGQDCLGVLRIQSHKLANFDESDIDFLSSVATLLAAVIKNTQTIQQPR